MKKQHVLNCAFSNWYNVFKELTIESKVIQLPSEFIEYLLEDGVVMPRSVDEDTSESISGDRGSMEEWSDNDEECAASPMFPSLEKGVKTAIKDLGGYVFPKLNWSAPRDAFWISSTGTLKCETFKDICLLLKSSDFIAHDLTKSFEYCEDSTDSLPHDGFELVLRKWIDISPAMEFRCFVKKNEIIAISQRDYTNYYDFLVECKDKVHRSITSFFNKFMRTRFVESSFVFDVYLSKAGSVGLIDINPFSQVTDSLLFSWHEIADELPSHAGSCDEMQGVMRIITHKEHIQPSPYLSYRMPRDISDIASGEDVNKLVEFLQEKRNSSS